MARGQRMIRRRIAPPGQGAAANPKQSVISPELRIAVFGDSIIWGQGQLPSQKFKRLVAVELGKIHRKRPRIVVDRSRSGAQIYARQSESDKRSPREIFIDTFPALFPSVSSRRRFRRGDESRATRLHGEVPSAFPTISWQVDHLDDALGETVDIVLMDGGANDIDFDDVINPQVHEGEFIEHFDGCIRSIAHNDFFELVCAARRKCPNALILCFGYFAPVSHSSHVSKIRAFFKSRTWALHWYVNKAFNIKSIGQLIVEAKVRSTWAASRAQHWMRAAISEANRENDIRGAGILFVPASIDPGTAAFANNPLIFEDYEHPANDPAQPERIKHAPRIKLYPLMRLVLGQLGRQGEFNSTKGFKDLAAATSTVGPISLSSSLTELEANPNRITRLEATRKLRAELSRLERSRIASFLHPNVAAAQQYANIAIRRYREHGALMQGLPQGPVNPPVVPGQPETIDAGLRRYGMRRAGSLAGDIGDLDVDAISVVVVTSPFSQPTFSPDVYLHIDTQGANGRTMLQYRLNFPYRLNVFTAVQFKLYPHFEPGQTNRFTIDTLDHLRLFEIRSMFLRIGPDPSPGNRIRGTQWQPRYLEIQFNGRTVIERSFRNRVFGPGAIISLRYPPKTPAGGGPVLTRL